MGWQNGKYKIEVSLDRKSIENAVGEIKSYGDELERKIDEFTRRMAEEGVDFAKARLIAYGAVDTGQLLDSIHMVKGEAIPHGSSWIVRADTPYAEYVEFGTGPVGNESPHPDGSGKYRTTGWKYYNDSVGHVVYTRGMKSRPFMWDTAQYLKRESTIKAIAQEVFG